MDDMIIKGTGNSRWLKSVANIMTLYPTYESFAEALAAGTFPIDLNGINPAGVEQAGTKLSKSNLLTDATAAGMGLTAAATPDQALNKLRQLVQTAQSGVDNGVKIVNGKYVGTHKYGESNPNTLTFAFSPKFLIVAESFSDFQYKNPASDFGIFVRDAIYSLYVNMGWANNDNKVIWGENSVSWYARSGNYNTQFNAINKEYCYFAIG